MSPEKISKAVTDYFEVHPLIGGYVKDYRPRWVFKIAAYLVRSELDLSFMQIGEAFGVRYSSVRNACAVVCDELGLDPVLEEQITEIRKIIMAQPEDQEEPDAWET